MSILQLPFQLESTSAAPSAKAIGKLSREFNHRVVVVVVRHGPAACRIWAAEGRADE